LCCKFQQCKDCAKSVAPRGKWQRGVWNQIFVQPRLLPAPGTIFGCVIMSCVDLWVCLSFCLWSFCHAKWSKLLLVKTKIFQLLWQAIKPAVPHTVDFLVGHCKLQCSYFGNSAKCYQSSYCSLTGSHFNRYQNWW